MKMKNGYTGIPAKVYPVIAQAVEDCGCVIWDIIFARRGADSVLTVTIDNNEGVGIEDCEKVTRAIDPLLDAADPIDCQYSLEVSSPGIERDMTMPWHFECCTGEEAALKLFSPLTEKGPKTLSGTILGYCKEDDTVIFSTGGGEVRIPFAAVSSAKLTYDFSKD